MHQALRVATQVQTWVKERPEGRVHSVFAKACNLAWGDWLISLVRPELGMVPGGVAVAVTGEEGWAFLPGEAVFWDQERQRLVGARSRIDLAQAVPWANQGPVSVPVGGGILAERVAEAVAVVRSVGRGELARVLATDPPSWPRGGDPLRWSSHAWEPMAALLRTLSSEGAAESRPALQSLIGLGEGLTPGCDDFVTGVLAVLHYGRAVLTPAQVAAGQWLAAEVERLAPSTTPVSANYLRLAADGGFSERLEAFLLALLTETGGDVEAAAHNLIETGHSSGTDSLVGVVLGLTIFRDDDTRRRSR